MSLVASKIGEQSLTHQIPWPRGEISGRYSPHNTQAK